MNKKKLNKKVYNKSIIIFFYHGKITKMKLNQKKNCKKYMARLQKLNPEMAKLVQEMSLEKQRHLLCVLLEGMLLKEKQQFRVRHQPQCSELCCKIRNEGSWYVHPDGNCPRINYYREKETNINAIENNINCLEKLGLMIFKDLIGYLYDDYDCDDVCMNGELS